MIPHINGHLNPNINPEVNWADSSQPIVMPYPRVGFVFHGKLKLPNIGLSDAARLYIIYLFPFLKHLENSLTNLRHSSQIS